MCDFTGFRVPEMIKKRPVIILTANIKSGNRKLATVVPLSSKQPYQ